MSNYISQKPCHVITNPRHILRQTMLTIDSMGPLLLTWIVLIPAWKTNYVRYTVWDEITSPFPNFNGTAVEVCEWISSFIPHFNVHVIAYPCSGLKLNHVSERDPWVLVPSIVFTIQNKDFLVGSIANNCYVSVSENNIKCKCIFMVYITLNM